jgi:phosphoglycerate dehydrogenase-like enzyme
MPAPGDRPKVVFARLGLVTEHLFTDEHYARLDALVDIVDRDPLESFKDERAEALLPQAEILVTGWGCPRIGSRVLDLAPDLRLVAHAAGTVRDLVTDSFWASGIPLISAADANAVPVAEFTVAAIVLANKRAFTLQRRYREAREYRLWDREVPAMGNRGKVVGVVGASRIGRRVVELLRPFELDVVLSDPYVEDEEAAALGVRRLDLDELLETADVVSLHAPLLPETRHLLDATRLARLRDGAVLINTARGALVDTDALTYELVSGRIEAVIDVTDPEILPAESPLYDLPNVFLTPHIAGANGYEVARMADLAIDEIERFVRGEPLHFQVEATDLSRIA